MIRHMTPIILRNSMLQPEQLEADASKHNGTAYQDIVAKGRGTATHHPDTDDSMLAHQQASNILDVLRGVHGAPANLNMVSDALEELIKANPDFNAWEAVADLETVLRLLPSPMKSWNGQVF